MRSLCMVMIAALMLPACTSPRTEGSEACLAGEIWNQTLRRCVPSGCEKSVHCDNGDVCDGQERCVDGECIRGAVLVCEGWETCDPFAGCVPSDCVIDADCADDIFCNGVERCRGKVCEAGDPPDCGDDIDCTVDTCDPLDDACRRRPDSTLCENDDEICDPEQDCIVKPCETLSDCMDGFFCNGEEVCEEGGICLSGLPVDCDDRVLCTNDFCSEMQAGCVSVPDDRNCPQPWKVCDPVLDCQDRVDCPEGEPCPPGETCRNGTCSADQDEPSPEEPAPLDGQDAGSDPGYDAGSDPGYDAGSDPGYDAGSDPGADPGTTDAGADADSGLDAGVDAGDPGGDAPECTNGTMEFCDTGLPGACQDGSRHCDNGQWDPCKPVLSNEPEVCNALDDDCDTFFNEDDVCACMLPCVATVDCPLEGEACIGDSLGYRTCRTTCDMITPCAPGASGDARVCVPDRLYGEGGVCVCVPDCPQACDFDEQCYPYGLDTCSGNHCTGDCISDIECPAPYRCDGSQCTCNANDIGTSCLDCSADNDCDPPAPCQPREEVSDTYLECFYPCWASDDCRETAPGLDLYCRADPDGNFPACACVPETRCQHCSQGDATACEPYGMECITFSGSAGMTFDACTTHCILDSDCPLDWICWGDGFSDGRCIEHGCNCITEPCNPANPGADEVCQDLGYELCMDDYTGVEIGICTVICASHENCPAGLFCDYQSPIAQHCRCRP